jgi:signal transduction histidine kinase
VEERAADSPVATRAWAERLPLAARQFSLAVAVFVILLGATVLAGWSFDLPRLQSFASSVSMKANCSVCFLLAGFSLLFLGIRGLPARGAGVLVSAAVAAVGAATLSEHLAGWDLRIDQILFREAPGAALTVSPGRMGPPASTCFTVAGTALVLLHLRRSVSKAETLALPVLLWSLLATIGYAYGAEPLYGFAQLTGIALHTAVGLFALGLGILAACAAQGGLVAVTSELAGGLVARRLLLTALVVPFLLGWVIVFGERVKLYDAGFGTAVLVLSIIVVFTALIWRSVTELHRSERLRQASEKETARLYGEAREAVRARDSFLSVAGHELRTPLNALRLQLFNLRRRSAAAAAAPAERDFARVEQQVERLIRLTGELLDVSRLDEGRLRLDRAETDLSQLVREVAERLTDAAHRAGSEIAVQADGPVVGSWDGFRLDQVLTNLLTNALKFGLGRPIEVAVTDGGGAATVVIRDRGIGIAAEDQARIFQRFERAVSEKSFGGMGLGLWISRQIVEAHGGTISVESEPGQGSVFALRLPKNPAETT